MCHGHEGDDDGGGVRGGGGGERAEKTRHKTRKHTHGKADA